MLTLKRNQALSEEDVYQYLVHRIDLELNIVKKRALVTGITGQDGSYLAEFLLAQSYDVVGMVRRSSTINFERIQQIQDRLEIVSGDLLDQASLIDILERYRPHEVYNLAAQSYVQTSWSQPVFTGEVTALGVTDFWMRFV